ncbi:MAG: hypothetical protein LBK95_03710 [Bifidobacteriaceae bacterium]|nr:hypothetical protein [Bifidobacteriaceae bacterium]
MKRQINSQFYERTALSKNKAAMLRRGETEAVGADEAHYALDGLPNAVLAAEYKLALPDEATLVRELARTRRELEARES